MKTAAVSARGDMVAAAIAAPILGPSIASATGTEKAKARRVSTPKRFSGVMFSPLGASRERRAKMLRVAKARLDAIAAPKASHVKESSVTEAMATPSTIGMSERATGSETACLRKRRERPHVNTGSAALTICVNETAPAEKERTAEACPIAWQAAIGSNGLSAALESRGAFRSLVVQRKRT